MYSMYAFVLGTEVVKRSCTLTEASFTRNCPHYSTTTFIAGDDGRGWWLMTVMVLLLSLVQLPWFTPCPENTGL